MATKSVSDSLALHPSGYTGLSNLSTSSSYPITNGYDGVDSSSYARLSLSTSSTGYLYYTFDCSEIPADATIESVACTVKARVSSTSRVTSTVCQLYTGTTAKGSNSTISSTSSTNTETLTTGTWTRSELNDLRLRIGGTGSSSSQSKYIYFYGATVTISFTYEETAWTVTASTSVGTIDPSGAQEIVDGESFVLAIYDATGCTVTDNGTDVTSSLVEKAVATGGTETFVPESYTTDGSISGTYYQSAVGQGSDTSNSSGGNNYASGGSSSTAYVDYSFGISGIPSNATITGISCSVKGKAESSTMDSSHFAKVCLYLDGTAIGDEAQFTSTSDSVITATATTLPSVSELDGLTLRFSVAYYGGNVVGATLSISYTVPSSGSATYYEYTISSVTADHVIVVSTGSSSSEAIWSKESGTWMTYSAVWKKSSGTWTIQAASAAFDEGTNYVRG